MNSTTTNRKKHQAPGQGGESDFMSCPSTLFKTSRLGPNGHCYNPSYAGGRNQEDHGWAKS
jgi:hypothetical protein